MAQTAELTLILKAKNLASGVVADLGAAVDTIKTKAAGIKAAFASALSTLGTAFTVFASDLAHGRSLKNAAVDAGLFMGATLIGSMAETMAKRLASSEIIGKIGVKLAILGTAIGTAIDTAIGIGMAAAPFVIIAALGYAVGKLVTDKSTRDKFVLGGQTLVKWIAEGLSTIGHALIAGLGKVPGIIADIVRKGVAELEKLARKIASSVNLLSDLGRFASGQGLSPGTIQTILGGSKPEVYGPPVPGKAAGGWVGLNGPQLVMTGERGPEYITPNHQLGASSGGGGFTIQGVSERQIIDMVDRGLYFKLQRAGASLVKA